MNYALAIDIGASSGRHIVGWLEDGAISTKEVYRFPNGVTEQNGHLIWDIDALVGFVKAGIAEAKKAFPNITSVSIDTWGVDYVLLKEDKEVYPVYAYRDGRTEMVVPKVHEKMDFAQLYRRTGCQFQPFNTIYQLYDEKVNGRLDGVTDMLMMPEYLMWKLCGVKAREYTNATTMGICDQPIFVPLSQGHRHRVAPTIHTDIMRLLLKDRNSLLFRVAAGRSPLWFAGFIVDAGR